mgnify:CR=1 FL=1
MDANLLTQVLFAFQPEAQTKIETLGVEDQQRIRAIEAAFTSGVIFLKALPNERIQSLANDIWNIFHHQYVTLAVGPPVETLSLAVRGESGILRALLIAPQNWNEMIKEDAFMQLGAIVMTGAQAVDFYNGRIPGDGAITLRDRCQAYEAEYLRTVKPPKPNDYQKHLMDKFKTFPSNLEYTRKAVMPKN